MAKLKPGVNDLRTWCNTHGEKGYQLLSYWTGKDEFNYNIEMDNTTYGSSVIVKWECDYGHTWYRSINRMTHKDTAIRCPTCYRIKQTEERRQISIKDWCMEHGKRGEKIYSEWTGLTADDKPIDISVVSYTSDIRAKWKCNKGHEFISVIGNRTLNSASCPICDRDNKIETTLKDWCDNNGKQGHYLLGEWVGQYENGQRVEYDKISYMSTTKVKWECCFGHIYVTSVRNKIINKVKCPHCTKVIKVHESTKNIKKDLERANKLNEEQADTIEKLKRQINKLKEQIKILR